MLFARRNSPPAMQVMMMRDGKLTAISGLHYDIRNPVLTPDGKQVLYLAGSRENHTLWAASTVGAAEPKQLETAGDMLVHLAVSATGRIALVRAQERTSVRRAELLTSGSRVLQSTLIIQSSGVDCDAHVSPDMKRLYYFSFRRGFRELMTAQVDGSRQKSIHEMRVPGELSPAWTSDSKGIVGVMVTDKSIEVRRFDPETMDTRLTHTIPIDKGRFVGISRDSEHLYLGSRGAAVEPRLTRLSISSGEVKLIAGVEAREVKESPDRKHLFYVTRQGEMGVWRVPAGGGTPERVAPIVFRRLFSPGSRGLYFAPNRNRIDYLDFGTGQVSTVEESAKQLSWGLDVSADERMMFYSVVEHEGSDLYLTRLRADR